MKELYLNNRPKKYLYLFIFAILLCGHSTEIPAQTSTMRKFSPDPSLVFEEVTIKDANIPAANVTLITQSSDGYIWLATQNKLLLYNGYNYEAIEQNIIKQRMFSFFEDENKDCWIGTKSGLFVIRNKKVFPRPELNQLNSLSINSISKINDGALWIGTNQGIYTYKNHILSKFETFPSVNTKVIKQDRKGIIWVGSTGNGIYLIRDNKIIKRYSFSRGFPTSDINQIVVDEKNNVWVGSRKGLLRFVNYEYTLYDQRNGLENLSINDLIKDKNSNIWLATQGGVFSFSDNKFTRYAYNEGLSNDYSYCIFEDREGNIFVGTHSNALNKLRKNRLKIYNTRNGLSSSWLWSIIQDKHNNIWIGTNENGVDKISNDKITNYSIKNGLPGNSITSICEDKNGDIWFGSSTYGVSKFKNGIFTTYTTKDGLAGNTVHVLYSDKKGNLWIGTNTGLTVYDFKKFKSYTIKNGLPSDTIRCITEDKPGRMLIGTYNGMSIFDNSKFKNYSVKDGLSDNMVFSIEVDSSNAYWIGTYYNGFNRMKDGKFFRFTQTNGLIDSLVYQLFISNNTDLVVSCNVGVYSIKMKELNDFADGKTKGPLRLIVYERKNGSSVVECNGGNQPSGWKLKNGEIWISTLSGVASIHPEKTETNDIKPLTIIDKVFLDNKQIDFAGSIEVPPGTDILQIEYSAQSFLNPQKNKYKFMIEGIDSDWIDAGTHNVKYLSNLPYGKYYFKVISSNNDGFWNETPAVLEMIIKPYFYQTKWFFLALIAVVSGMIYSVYRIRIKSLKRRETELVELVDERTNNLIEAEKTVKSLLVSKEKFLSIITHDMKNLFTAHLYYSKELYNNFSNLSVKKSTDYIEKINLSATSLFELFNNLLIWSKIQTGTLVFKSDKINLNSIVKVAFNSFKDYSKRKNVSLENEIQRDLHVVMDRNMLLMIMNNLFFNAMKLSKPETNIKVYSEEINHDELKISVENSGIPVKKDELDKIFNDHSIRPVSNTQNEWSTALGLLLCKELIEKNGGDFSVNIIPEAGNIISFTIKKG
jgi:ligand-binding sensor domain-containing protein/signal transduction histidine kinase